MERDDHIAAIRAHGERLAGAAEVDLAAPVPSCPGWTAADLVAHVDVICQFWLPLVTGAIADPTDFRPRPAAAASKLVPSFRADVVALADVLAPLEPTMPCWTWSDRHEVGFVQRRMAQEIAVHGWDATLAAGRPQPLEPMLAIDGIDEYLDVFVPARAGHADGASISVHLHATDADGEWVVKMGDGRWSVERAHAKGDVAVRATASDLLLMLWGRRPPDDDAFEVFGEPELLAGFLERTTPG
jgi:uncharacterized protein (TIGR03083 family)